MFWLQGSSVKKTKAKILSFELERTTKQERHGKSSTSLSNRKESFVPIVSCLYPDTIPTMQKAGEMVLLVLLHTHTQQSVCEHPTALASRTKISKLLALWKTQLFCFTDMSPFTLLAS
eukprot:scaffold3276_cov168-Amphora_coffeaeformis.AAC.4